MKKEILVQNRYFSLSLSKKIIAILFLLAILIFLILIIHIKVGDYPISWMDLIKTMLGVSEGDFNFIIFTLRLPRALTGLLVGMALSVAGTIIQGLTRNPLASPGILGLNAGASLAVVCLIVFFPEIPFVFHMIGAFLGAFTTFVIVYFLSMKRGSSTSQMLLIGIGLTSILHSLLAFIMITGKIKIISQANIWITGSLYGASWEQLIPLFFSIVFFTPFILVIARYLNVLALGDAVSLGLGIQLKWKQLILLLICVGLVSSAIAIVGTVGFIGLIAPHLARFLVGSNHGELIPTASMIGGLMVLIADLIGKTIWSPIEVPVGVIIAFIGAPYFLYLVLRQS